MTLKEMMDRQDDILKKIRSNRLSVSSLLGKNRKMRKEFSKLRNEIYEYVLSEMKEGKSLYQVCLNNFGKIDRRFHALYSICINKIKS